MEIKRHGLLVFLLITFGAAWTYWFAASQFLGLSLVNPLVQVPGAFIPAIAAVIVRRWVTTEGFRTAGLSFRLKSARHYYLLAWLGPVLVAAATVGTAVALGLYRLDLAPLAHLFGDAALPVPVALLLFLTIPVLMIPIFWGEEFGWRSYLQTHVSKHPVRAALITGIVWAGWHYPLIFTDYAEFSNPAFGTLLWTVKIVLEAVILAWLFLRSGSVWVACLAHAGNNIVLGGLNEILLVDGGNLDSSTVDLLELVPLAAICLWIILSRQLTAARPAGAVEPTVESAAVDGPRHPCRSGS